MKKTQWIALLMNIRGTLVSFFSIAVFVMLAIGIYIGFHWGAQSITSNTDQIVMADGRLADIEAFFPYGLGEDAVEAVSALPGVSSAEGSNRAYGNMQVGSETFYSVFHQLPGDISSFLSVEGTLPQGENEVALELAWAQEHAVRLGDRVFLSGDFNRSFEVTALVESPIYSSGRYGVSLENGVDVVAAAYLSGECWSFDAGFNSIRIRSAKLRKLPTMEAAYSDENKKLQETVRQCLAPYVEERLARLAMVMEVVPCEVSFLSAAQNVGLCMFHTIGLSAASAQFFAALLFVLVGLLVCYSAISRLAFEQMTRIGTLKALGLRKREISLSYALYTMLSALIGCALAPFLGRLIARVFLLILMDGFPGELRIYTSSMPYIMIAAIELVLTLFVTLFACRRVLKQRAVTLLGGPVPPQGKVRFFERLKIWERTSLLTKTMVNNCLNDKRRVFSTVLGITSCTALLVMALTLNFDANHGFSIQTEDYYHFDTLVYFDATVPDAQQTLQDILSENGFDSLAVYREQALADTVGEDDCLTKLYVPSDMERFRAYYTLNPVTESDKTPYEGAWMNNAYLKTNGGAPDQTVTAHLGTGETVDIPLGGFFEDYAFSSEIIMSPQAYEACTGRSWCANCILLDRGDCGIQDLMHQLDAVDGYLSVRDFTELVESDYDLYRMMDIAIVAIALSLSVVMAFLVILNLLTMFVAEKKKELIILRINGYSIKDARRYLSRDTVVLTVISILLSFPLGCVTGILILRSLECSMLYMYKGISWISFGIAGLASGLLVLLASRIAMKPIGRWKLSDINQ